MASWGGFSVPEPKEESEKQTPSSGGIVSFFSGLVSSVLSAETNHSSVNSPSSEHVHEIGGKSHRDRTHRGSDSDLDNSWEKVAMEDLKTKVQ